MSLETSSHRARQKEPAQTELFLGAARTGNYHQLVEALSEGADCFAKTLRGQSALMLAAASEGEDTRSIVEFLLEVSMELEAKDERGWTAFHCACRNNNREVLNFLLLRSADLHATTHAGETAPMLTALEPDSDRLVLDLLGKRASLEPRDERGYSLLFYAVELGRDDLAKWLLKHKASAKEKAMDRTTALMIAAQVGNVDIAKRLFYAKANINSKNLKGNSPIMFSLAALEEPVSLWLLDQMADVIAANTNDKGESAMDLALAGDLMTIINLIEQAQRRHAAMLAAEAEEAEEKKRTAFHAQQDAAAKEKARLGIA